MFDTLVSMAMAVGAVTLRPHLVGGYLTWLGIRADRRSTRLCLLPRCASAEAPQTR